MGGVTGTTSPSGGAPKPDPARAAAIRYTIVDEPETCAAFGEAARAGLAALNDRTLAETRSGDLGECNLLLDHVRDRVAALDPARLEPRGGLAGLFDSRSKRLKAFRAAYAAAASAVTQSAAELGDRAGALGRKGAALETLWSETRDAITELDAHIAAARSWLANEAPAVAAQASVDPAADLPETTENPPPEATEVEADTLTAATSEASEPASDTAEPVAERAPEPPEAVAPESKPAHEPAPVVSLPHPLETRLIALEAVRATAIGRLPLMRAAQNADHQAPITLKRVCDAIEAWRADWQDALGLAGKKPKKIRPDRVRLANALSALIGKIQSAGHELSAAQGRRAELDARSAPRPAPALAA